MKKSAEINFHHAMMKNTISSIRKEESIIPYLAVTPFENSILNKDELTHS